MRSIAAGLVTAIALLAAAAGPAPAQTPPSLSGLAERLKPGDVVWVETTEIGSDAPPGIKGTLLAASESSLLLEVKGKRREFTASEVLVVSRRHSKKVLGAVIGAGIGAVLGAAMVRRDCYSATMDPESCSWAKVGAGVPIAAGVTVGAILGKLTEHEHVLFRAPDIARGQALRVAPVIGKGRAGVTGILRF